MMFAISIFYILLRGYSARKAIVVFLVCIYRLADGFADVFESQFHKDGRLDIAGKSLAFRTILSVAAYFLVLVISGNLVSALVAAIITAIAGVWLFDILVYAGFGKIELNLDKKMVFHVLKSCFPLFLGVFLWTYILSASRLAIDKYMSSEYQSYYQVLFMPVSVINLFAGFVFRPMLLSLTECYAKKNYSRFFGIIGKNICIMLLFTLICMIGAYAIGIPVLSFLVNCDLEKYRGLLVFLIFSGGLNAVAFILYYVLTIIRSNRGIITGYVISAILAFVISPVMVNKSGMSGAGMSYFIVIVVLNIIFSAVIAINVKKNKKMKG
jgi:O-antigen/teichoic acid export membrane protein